MSTEGLWHTMGETSPRPHQPKGFVNCCVFGGCPQFNTLCWSCKRSTAPRGSFTWTIRANSASGTVICENYGENRVETQYKKIHLELSPLSETVCSTPGVPARRGTKMVLAQAPCRHVSSSFDDQLQTKNVRVLLKRKKTTRALAIPPGQPTGRPLAPRSHKFPSCR